MRRRTKDPKKCQEVFFFALEAIQWPFVPTVVHDEVVLDLETIDLSKKPGLITASGVSAVANNSNGNVLTKSMIAAMVKQLESNMTKPPTWVVPPDLLEQAKDILDIDAEDEEWAKQFLNSCVDV